MTRNGTRTKQRHAYVGRMEWWQHVKMSEKLPCVVECCFGSFSFRFVRLPWTLGGKHCG